MLVLKVAVDVGIMQHGEHDVRLHIVVEASKFYIIHTARLAGKGND
jgi:hypothetical protein